MTPRELEILYTIDQLGKFSTIAAISKKIGLSLGYCSILSKALIKQKLIRQANNNVFAITPKGKSLIKQRDHSKTYTVPALPPIKHNLNRIQNTERIDAQPIQVILKLLTGMTSREKRYMRRRVRQVRTIKKLQEKEKEGRKSGSKRKKATGGSRH